MANTTRKTGTRGKRTITRKVAEPKQPEAAEMATQEMAEQAKQPQAPQRLKPRVPIGQRRPLHMTGSLDPNYEYRHVRGRDNNIQRYLDAGYEFVTDDLQVGDSGIMRGGQPDSRVSVPSGDSNDRLYLMRIPKEFYDEDQTAKQAAIDKKEEALKPSAEAQGLEGKLTISR